MQQRIYRQCQTAPSAKDLALQETLFHNANGYIGVRGTLEAGLPDAGSDGAGSLPQPASGCSISSRQIRPAIIRLFIKTHPFLLPGRRGGRSPGISLPCYQDPPGATIQDFFDAITDFSRRRAYGIKKCRQNAKIRYFPAWARPV